jgi:4-hydroxybenzoate polyprenyltransferase
MAQQPLPETVSMLSLFGMGSILLRGAGCTINDLWDRRLDQQVERTKQRPLAAGIITPFQAVLFLGLQCSLGLCILVQLNTTSILWGASSLLLVGTYPLMKRITYWPQLVLGMTFNWGALLGSTAMLGTVDPSAWCLYLGGIAWTLVYDTIYACQDLQDDLKVGIKSTAIRFGSHLKRWLSGFASMAVLGFMGAGYLHDSGVGYYLGVGGTAAHFLWQIKTLQPKNRQDCWNKFKSNRNVGLLLLGGIVLDSIWNMI